MIMKGFIVAKDNYLIEAVSKVWPDAVGVVVCGYTRGFCQAGAFLGGFAARRVIMRMAAHWTMAAWWAGSRS
jgi:hypothetical protein